MIPSHIDPFSHMIHIQYDPFSHLIISILNTILYTFDPFLPMILLT